MYSKKENEDFLNVLADHGGGRLLLELDKRLADLLAAIEKEKKPGQLKLTLKIQPNSDGTATVTPHISESRPYPQPRASEFFLQNKGLHKDDPRQPNLFNNVKDIKQVK